MKIGITGTWSAGKSSLAVYSHDRLLKIFPKMKLDLDSERKLKNLGFELEKQSTPYTQLLMLTKEIQNLRYFDDYITDNCALTVYVYTKVLGKLNQWDKEYIDAINKMIEDNVHLYNHIFFVSTEIPLEEDGLRSSDLVFREEIFKEINRVVNKFKDKTNIHFIKGNLIEKTNQILSIIKGE